MAREILPPEVDEFLKLMRNRMVMGTYRYGDFRDNTFYDHEDEVRIRLARFFGDGNLEHLVDAANFVLLIYAEQKALGRTLSPIDDGPHKEGYNL